MSEVTVTFVGKNGERREVRGQTNRSLMEAAIKSNVPNIEAECGGACSCATCHVYVAAEWMEKVGQPASTIEAEMIEFSTEERRPTSRLACQITLTDEFDGLVVYTARS